LDILMLKSSQLHGGFAPPDLLCPWTPLGASPPDPRYILNTGPHSCIGGVWGASNCQCLAPALHALFRNTLF